MKHFLRPLVLTLMLFSLLVYHVTAENIWDLEAVNADGTASHPKAGASPTNPANKVTIEGIALNTSLELLNPNLMWQVYVQAESPDQGGIAAWAGIFYNSNWPRYPEDIYPGDRIRIEGFIVDHNGKVNINERHSADPSLQFTVTILDRGVGLPTPQEINDLSTCNYFDQTRAGGGEKYQAQWVQINEVHIASGIWGAGNSLILEDDAGSTLSMFLSSEGDFDSYAEPTGDFSVRGIFDQEDPTAPYHDNYRIWVKHYLDIIREQPLAAKFWDMYE
jgi:hypothetical protein